MGSQSSRCESKGPRDHIVKGSQPGAFVYQQSPCNLSFSTISDRGDLKNDLCEECDEELEFNEKWLRLRPRPLDVFCPYCNRIVRTSADIETELKYFMKEVENNFKPVKCCKGHNQTKLTDFASIKKATIPPKSNFSRSYYEPGYAQPHWTSFVPNTRSGSIDYHEPIYDTVSNENVLQETSLNLNYCQNKENRSESETPRSLKLSESLWRY